MLEIINEIVDLIDDAFDNKHLLNCNLIGLYNYIKYGNEDFDGDNKGIEVVYKIIFGVKAIENQFDIKEQEEEYIEVLNNLEVKYKIYLEDEINILKGYFN